MSDASRPALIRALIQYLKWGFPWIIASGVVFFYVFAVRVFGVARSGAFRVFVVYALALSIFELGLNFLEERKADGLKLLRFARMALYSNAIGISYFAMPDMLYRELWLVGGMALSVYAYITFRRFE